jgi:hypothetical protein
METHMHTRCFLAAALVAVLAGTAGAQQPAAPPATPAAAPALSEAQRLKAPLLSAQMEAAENAIALGQARLALLKRAAQDLEAEYLATVKAPPGSTWDWVRMVPVMPPAPPKP